MEIKYMQQLRDNPILNGMEIEGATIQEIEEIEKKHNNGKPLPKAFREYLFLAGKGSHLSLFWDDEWDYLAEELLDTLEVCNIQLNRPVFPFAFEDGCVFTFFYLDENAEDPDIYILEPDDLAKNPRFPIFPSNSRTFSILVNEIIYRKKNGYRL